MDNHLKKMALALTLSLVASFPVLASHHQHSPEFARTKVTDHIDMLTGKGGNVGVLTGDDGVLLIDDDYHGMTQALRDALQSLGHTGTVAYVVNTHWHGDHTDGNLALGREAQIVAHDNVRIRLLQPQEIKQFNMTSDPYPEEALPEITYSATMTLHINGEIVDIVHYPNGHTDGDSVVFFRNANVVHMGDHFFNGFFPFIDVGTGGNIVSMTQNVGDILARIDKNTRVIPGHGALASKAELQSFHDMLLATTDEVSAMMADGLDLPAIQARGLSAQWQFWAKGFINSEVWIGIIYSSLESLPPQE
jgi:cyclase